MSPKLHEIVAPCQQLRCHGAAGGSSCIVTAPSYIKSPFGGYAMTKPFFQGQNLDSVQVEAYSKEFLGSPEDFTEGQDSQMDKKRLDYYKKKLMARREELMKTIARTEEEGRQADDDPTVDLADKAANSYTKEFLFGMTNSDRTILNMIDEALKRIKANEYGSCANCQEEMAQKRLEAVPWAKHCISCQEKIEQGLL
jgi:DnaK suppressor protein